MLSFRHTGRMLASTALAAAIALPRLVGAPAGPLLAPTPGAIFAQGSGKVADRMPGFGPAAPAITAALIPTPTRWPLSATLQTGAAFAFTTEPTQVASAAIAPARDRPARSVARAQRIGTVQAHLPPARPAALVTGGLVASARPREARPSIVARMASLVGSLATLDAFL